MNRIVVVTGGGTGFGRATAERFAASGDTVYITGRRAQVLERAAASAGGNLTPIACDGTDPDSIAEAFAAINGDVDVLINNAGGNTDFSEEDGGGLAGTARRWRANFDANVLTAVLATDALSGRISAGGAVISIGSIGAEQGGTYGAAKAALAAWNSGLAAELGTRDITSNVIAPGYFPNTEFFGDGLPKDIHDSLIDRTALGRPGEVDEIASSAFFLASEEARYITGHVLHVNGGAHRTR